MSETKSLFSSIIFSLVNFWIACRYASRQSEAVSQKLLFQKLIFVFPIFDQTPSELKIEKKAIMLKIREHFYSFITIVKYCKFYCFQLAFNNIGLIAKCTECPKFVARNAHPKVWVVYPNKISHLMDVKAIRYISYLLINIRAFVFQNGKNAGTMNPFSPNIFNNYCQISAYQFVSIVLGFLFGGFYLMQNPSIGKPTDNNNGRRLKECGIKKINNDCSSYIALNKYNQDNREYHQDCGPKCILVGLIFFFHGTNYAGAFPSYQEGNA